MPQGTTEEVPALFFERVKPCLPFLHADAHVLCSMGKTALQVIVIAEPAGSGLQELSRSPVAATGDPVSLQTVG